jgi:hypothetical protein
MPGQDKVRVKFNSESKEKIRECLAAVSEVLKGDLDVEDDEVFLQASTKATANTGNRKVRHTYLKNRIVEFLV